VVEVVHYGTKSNADMFQSGPGTASLIEICVMVVFRKAAIFAVMIINVMREDELLSKMLRMNKENKIVRGYQGVATSTFSHR